MSAGLSTLRRGNVDWSLPHGLYRIFDAERLLAYVGISVDPAARVAVHRSVSPWGGLIHAWTVEWHPDRSVALRVEQWVIDAELPYCGMIRDLYREVAAISARGSLDKQALIAQARARYSDRAKSLQLARLMTVPS